ncbi:hypothetical protein [Thiolapillus sp.]|uniref:hypothetical protein n=1 Tax=Thiolapillus sp. TaxID=2017437 RepID=UPI0025D0D314|nr:hypothetical protein [Thiolapillus sp.]
MIAQRGHWQNALPDNAPEMIDATLATLASLVSNVSNTTRRGRAMRLAEAVAAMHLVNANASLNNHLQRNKFNQFPAFCNYIAQAASAMYGVYVLASQDGQDAIKEACIQLSEDQVHVIKVHERLQEIEQHAKELEKNLESAEAKASEQATTCEQYSEQADEKLEEIERSREQTIVSASEAKTREDEITELADEAGKLRADIDARIQASQDAQQQLQALTEQAAEIRKELESLLPGATAAGLAAAYKKTKDEISDRMDTLFTKFWLGLGALIGTLVLGHVLLPPLPTELGPLMLQVLSRAMLASPAVWFTWVVVRQYTYLSRLHTDYGFKEAVATSFEGFRRMMEELDEADNKDLTAALSIKAIDIIGSDPDRLGSRHHGDDSPWSHVLKTLTGRLFSGKGGEE